MPCAAQRSLVKPFEPSSCGGRLRWTEHFDAGGFEIVGETGDERRLWPDHHEADVLLLAEADYGIVIRNVEGDAFGNCRDPGIARRAIEPVEQGALLELPGERVLSPAGPDQQHIHSGAGSACRPHLGPVLHGFVKDTNG